LRSRLIQGIEVEQPVLLKTGGQVPLEIQIVEHSRQSARQYCLANVDILLSGQRFTNARPAHALCRFVTQAGVTRDREVEPVGRQADTEHKIHPLPAGHRGSMSAVPPVTLFLRAHDIG
jgi:hypothetical protein